MRFKIIMCVITLAAAIGFTAWGAVNLQEAIEDPTFWNCFGPLMMAVFASRSYVVFWNTIFDRDIK